LFKIRQNSAAELSTRSTFYSALFDLGGRKIGELATEIREDEDLPGLVEAAGTFPGLEGVERGGDDEQKGEEESHHEGAVHP
jgi:hypothetical protein